MSLDVYLTQRKMKDVTVYAREGGVVREITSTEWREHFPGTEPVIFGKEEMIYEDSITHNLDAMADAAGIYKELWRPEEIGIVKARQLIGPLSDALVKLHADPAKFKLFNPDNGWGNYEMLVKFVTNYKAACDTHPDARVSVSR